MDHNNKRHSREYLLIAMLKYAGYRADLSPSQLNRLIGEFNINIHATPDLLAAQVNQLMKTEKFNNFLNKAHEAKFMPRPVPQFTSGTKNEEELIETLRQAPRITPTPRPTPFGTQ